MEARAIHRYLPTSPRKMRLVVDLIRGKGVEEALSILHFSPKYASKEAEKTLRSAVANLQNQEDAGRVEFSQLYVKEAYVDEGPSMKRILPAPMGRAYRIQKRSNHLTIVVAMREEALREQRAREAKKKEKAKAKRQTKKKETAEQEKES